MGPTRRVEFSSVWPGALCRLRFLHAHWVGRHFSTSLTFLMIFTRSSALALAPGGATRHHRSGLGCGGVSSLFPTLASLGKGFYKDANGADLHVRCPTHRRSIHLCAHRYLFDFPLSAAVTDCEVTVTDAPSHGRHVAVHLGVQTAALGTIDPRASPPLPPDLIQMHLSSLQVWGWLWALHFHEIRGLGDEAEGPFCTPDAAPPWQERERACACACPVASGTLSPRLAYLCGWG